jgi:hypothetical protein
MNHADRNLFIGSMTLGLVLVIINIIFGLTAPTPEPKYTGDVNVISKNVRGYACIVRYVQSDGKEDGAWLGKPGSKICDPINLGPAKMVDGKFVQKTLRD